MAETMTGLELSVDLGPLEGFSIPSNLAQLTELCEQKAAEFKGIHEIDARYTYRDAKVDRAAINRLVKQVEDERKRVKRAFNLPLTEFESGVKSALRPLTEVKNKQDKLIKEYEARGRVAKRGRLEAYWEQKYPALALCTGEASEPLVPFDRIFDPDWTKRVSELDEGWDVKATEQMDAIADRIATEAGTISQLSEPDDVRSDAMSRYYRTLDLSSAIDGAREEARRKADMARLAEAQAAAQVPAVEPRQEPQAPRSQAQPEPQQVAAETMAPDSGVIEPIGHVIIPIYTRAQRNAVIAVMKRERFSGTYKPVRRQS